MLEQVSGNILAERTDAVVNPVNCVGVMGKGLALAFKNKWPSNYLLYADACARGVVKPGQMFTVNTGLQAPRYIINFPTKVHWKNPSRLVDIETGLVSLVNAVTKLGIPSISIPALGCGLGGLAWSDVFPLIQRAAAQMPSVRVRVFLPAEEPVAPVRSNPLGLKVGPNTRLVRMGKGRMVHIKHPTEAGTLCAPQHARKEKRQREFARHLRAAGPEATQATCYRCLKVNTMNEAGMNAQKKAPPPRSLTGLRRV